MDDTQTIGPYVRGEKPLPLIVTFTEDDEITPIPLTGYVARVVIAPPGEAAVEREADVTSPPEGEVTYVWDQADLELGTGTYEMEVWVGNGTHRLASKRYVFFVREALAVPAI